LGSLPPQRRRNEPPTPHASLSERGGWNRPQQAIDGDKSPAESGDKLPHSPARPSRATAR